MGRFLSALFLLVSLPSAVFGQLEVPKEVESFDPIIVSLAVSSKPNTDIQVTWRVSSDKVKYEVIPNANILHVWAPPGDHWVEATVASQSFREMLVLVPDPVAPTDLTKAKAEKVKIAQALSLDRFTGNFKVRGSVVPDVPVTPVTPVSVPTAEMQQLMGPVKATVASGDKAKAAIWRSAFVDYLDTLKEETPYKTTAEFKTATTRFMNAAGAKAGLKNAFPGFTAAMDAAFATHFGVEDTALNWQKALDFVAATIWACSP